MIVLQKNRIAYGLNKSSRQLLSIDQSSILESPDSDTKELKMLSYHREKILTNR